MPRSEPKRQLHHLNKSHTEITKCNSGFLPEPINHKWYTQGNQFFEVKLKIDIHIPIRQLSTGRRAIMLRGSGIG